MGLSDLLYRCPECGADPTEGTGRRARCPACGAAFRPTPDGLGIRIRTSAGARDESLAALVRAISAHGGPLTRAAAGSDGSLVYEAQVLLREAHREEAVRHAGRLLGFTEQFGPSVPGTLELRSQRLRFVPSGAGRSGFSGGPDAESGDRTWELRDMRALQASSSAVQLSPVQGGVLLCRFPDDSPRRWELLLAEALQRVWTTLGRGEIVEFQPRIRAR
ncbi:MAG: hypothetical protein ACOCUZ_02975 [bacterium]